MKTLYLIILVLIPLLGTAQKFTISGSVRDQNTGESLIGAGIFNIPSAQGTTANTYGFYSLTLVQDTAQIQVSYVGYATVKFKFFLQKDTTINVDLTSGTDLKEVVITGTADENIQESTRMSTIDLPVSQIKAMPALFGETDVFKVLQLLPGVQSGAEGTSGLYVRGGGPDQNLILLDGVPVYNASHLFGFLSVFNADAINRVELIKGGFPARYGGRLSSVIDISMKEGNTKKLQGEGSIGLIASRLTLEAPINDKTSFIVSGRRTYIDLLARPIIRKQSDGDAMGGYYFYDLNSKINHRINDNNKVYLSIYLGNDKAFAKSKSTNTYEGVTTTSKDNGGLQWGNITTALRWNKIISNKLFSNLTATYSRYRFNVYAASEQRTTAPDTTYGSHSNTAYISGIRDYAVKLDFDYMPNPDHYIKFGGQAIQHLFTPGVFNYASTAQGDTTLGAQKVYAREFAVYLEDDFLFTHNFKLNGGIHASGFYVAGKFYYSIQPRVSARYLLSPALSLKASYAQMAQYIHLLTNVGLGLPTDLWVPTTPSVQPERSYISAVGGAYNFNNKYEFSLEGYYKKMKGLIEYKDGASYIDIENDWQTKVESGDGESYGAEFFAQKKTGRINGWVGYTLSWTNRTFENLNEGRAFPYKYDRRHDIEIAAMYELRKNKEFSMTWVYGTGSAVTLPQSTYAGHNNQPYDFYGGEESIRYYDGRNSYRMRAYHRLDLNYTTTKKTKWGERSWSIGVYNVYSRRNPFFLDLTTDEKGNKRFVQYSLFPVIPSIAYRFKF